MAPLTLMRATFSASTVDASNSDPRIAKIHRWQFIASAFYHAESRLQRIGSDCHAMRRALPVARASRLRFEPEQHATAWRFYRLAESSGGDCRSGVIFISPGGRLSLP